MEIKALNIGELAQPFTKLIEVISKGCGILYQPYHYRKMIKEKADAIIVLAKAEKEAFSLLNNTINTNNFNNREEYLNFRRNNNLLSIINKAVHELPKENIPNDFEVNEDWAIDFFNICQDIGDNEMQSLWAKILSGETSKPGSFSSRTLNAVKLLNKNDAILFTEFSNHIIIIDNEYCVIHGFNNDNLIKKYFEKIAFNFKNIEKLRNLNLVYSAYKIKSYDNNSTINMNYYGDVINYKYKRTINPTFYLEPRFLTDIGIELFPICGSSKQNDYFNALKEDFLNNYWESYGV